MRREGVEFPTASTPSEVSQGVGPRPQGLIWQEGDKPHTQPIRFRVQLACLDFRLQTPRAGWCGRLKGREGKGDAEWTHGTASRPINCKYR